MIKLFDTHAHLDDKQIAPILEQVIADAQQEGLVGVTAIGTTLETSQACVELTRRFEMVFASVGIHPNYCQEVHDQEWDEVVELSKDPKVVAIGETGLDRYWDDCPFDRQEFWFAKHIDLSFETQKPLVIHMRECEPDIVRMLQKHQREGQVIGIMHSFTGNLETARFCLDLGMYISFAGMVTFKKSTELREVAKAIPSDRILVETDSPYLSPHPHRGKRPNQPAMVRFTAQCLAESRGISMEEFGEITTNNAKRVFGLDEG